MSIVKWFKSLFSNKYSIVYDPARDDGDGVSLSDVEVTKSYSGGVDGRRIFLITGINEISTDYNGYLKKFILNIDIDHLQKGDILSTDDDKYTFVINKDTQFNQRGSAYRYHCEPYRCDIPSGNLRLGQKIFRTGTLLQSGEETYYGSKERRTFPTTTGGGNYSNYRNNDSDDVSMHLLLNPMSPMNVWHSSSNDCSHNSHSSSNHDSHDSGSSYDSGSSDSGGGDCGGGGD